MERLTRISSGVCETSSGALGVVPRRATRIDGGVAWFAFKGSLLGPSIRVEWPAEIGVAVIDAKTATLMVSRGYASHPTDEQLAAYNALADDDETEVTGKEDDGDAPADEPEPDAADADTDATHPTDGQLADTADDTVRPDGAQDEAEPQHKRRGRPPKDASKAQPDLQPETIGEQSHG